MDAKLFIISFGMPGPAEWLVILVVMLFIVGPKKLPELMRSIGKMLRSFKEGIREINIDDEKSDPKDPDSSKNKTSI